MDEYQIPIASKQKEGTSYTSEIIKLTHTSYTTKYKMYTNAEKIVAKLTNAIKN